MNNMKFWDKDGKVLVIRVSQSNKNANVFSGHRIPTPNDAEMQAAKSGFTRKKPR